MSGPVTVKFEGGMELDAAFRSLMDDFDASKATVKNTMRRGMKEALVPMADAAEANAPLLTGHLRDSITEGTKLTSRQSRLEKQKDEKVLALADANSGFINGLDEQQTIDLRRAIDKAGVTPSPKAPRPPSMVDEEPNGEPYSDIYRP